VPLNEETQKLYDAAAGNAAPPKATPSLADHEAQFTNTPRFAPPVPAADPVPDDATSPTSAPRHRARSQKATPEDLDAIDALTKRLRDAEAAAGIEVDRKEGESDRVYNLRKRAELAEAVAKARKPLEQPKPAAQPVQAPPTFDEAEPTIEQFKDKDDPYTAWQRALYAYDRRKEVAEWQQTQATEQQKQNAAAGAERKRQAYASFNTRVSEFQKATPDYDAVVRAVERPVTYLLETAMVNDPDGPRFVYELAKNPALHDELFVLTDNKPVNRDTVASVQRLLHARMPAAPTGSAAPQTIPLAPRPPNPVRTAPSAHVPKAPTDTASLADHEQFYGTGRRR
jgi:hypothetical protein